MEFNQPELISVPFANEGFRNPIPVNQPTGDTANQASYKQGFPSITMIPVVQGGRPPQGRDFNGIFYNITAHLLFQNVGGRYLWNADLSESVGGYPQNALVVGDDGNVVYISKTDNNTDNPNDSSSNWDIYYNHSALGSSVVDVSMSSDATSGTMSLTIKDQKTGDVTTENQALAIAGNETAGLMNAETYQNLQTAVSDITDLKVTAKQYQENGAPEYITLVDNGGVPFAYDKGAMVKWRMDESAQFDTYLSLMENNTSDPSVSTAWTQLVSGVAVHRGVYYNAFDGSGSTIYESATAEVVDGGTGYTVGDVAVAMTPSSATEYPAWVIVDAVD
ncbi:MAG: hypothetical protein LBK01_06880, partial [Burkholderiaceae bacterium]|nr:hypothetical protein [Burkholderiaceae bacterium]